MNHGPDAVPSPPPTPPDDDKDWTWVLGARCPECGFDASSIAGPQVAGLVRQSAVTWRQALAGAEVSVRPAPQVWSVLEYGAHCRDVCAIFGERVALMLQQPDPHFPNWDQDASAIERHYWDSDPAVVSDDLADNAESAAVLFEAVTGDQWSRTGRRSNGSVFTVETLGRYFLHDLVHHLHDVGRPLVR